MTAHFAIRAFVLGAVALYLGYMVVGLILAHRRTKRLGTVRRGFGDGT